MTGTAKPRAKKRAKPEKAAPEGLSQDEAARRVGCSQSTIGRAIRRGDIEILINGRIPESEIPKLIELRKEDERENAEKADLERRMLKAELGEREAKAKLRVMEVERESGRVVDLAVVRADAANARERIIGVLRALPQRVAAEVDAALSTPLDRRAAVIEKLIAAEVERAIAELAESKYGGRAA